MRVQVKPPDSDSAEEEQNFSDEDEQEAGMTTAAEHQKLEQEQERQAQAAAALRQEQERQRRAEEAAEAAAAQRMLEQEQEQERECLGKEKDWSQMTQQERDAVLTLGFTESTWTDPELFGDADFPLFRPWKSLTPAELSAAASLGYQHEEFGPPQEKHQAGQSRLRNSSSGSDGSDGSLALFSMDTDQAASPQVDGSSAAAPAKAHPPPLPTRSQSKRPAGAEHRGDVVSAMRDVATVLQAPPPQHRDFAINNGDQKLSVELDGVAEEDTVALGKDKEWSAMTTQERQAVENLGFTEATWTNPDLLNPSEDPFLTNWEDLLPRQQAAASALGFSAQDWEADMHGDGSGAHQATNSESTGERKREMLAKFAVSQSNAKTIRITILHGSLLTILLSAGAERSIILPSRF